MMKGGFAKGFRSGLDTATAVSIILLLSSPYWWPGATWVFCIAAGGCSIAWLCRRVSDDPLLARITVASYGVRVLLTLVLFSISAWELPILEEIQRGHGFWQIGGDGIGYHETALRMLDAWRLEIDLPSVFRYGVQQHHLFKEFSLVVAFIYRLLGPFLLHALFVNAWLGALGVIPGYMLVRTLADRKGARLAAALIGFWPSSLIWSTQLLKEPSTALAILTLFCCLALLWRGLSWRGTLAAWVGVAGSAAALTFFRNYMGYVLLTSVGAVMGLACIRHLWHRRWWPAGRAALLIAVIGTAVRVTVSTDFLTVFSTRHPEPAHLALGARYEQAGDIERAMLAYIRVLELAPDETRARDQLKRLTDLVVQGRVGGQESPLPLRREEALAALEADRGIATYMRPLELEPRRTTFTHRPLKALIGESLEARRWLYERGKLGQRQPEPQEGPADPLDVDPRVIQRAAKVLNFQIDVDPRVIQRAATVLASSTSVLQPVEAPASPYTVTVSSARVVAGGTIVLTWTAPNARPEDDWLGLYPVGVPREATNLLWWTRTNGLFKGSVTASAPAVPGRYQAVYFLNDSYQEAARSRSVTVVESAVQVPPPTLSLSATQPELKPGQVSVLNWASVDATSCAASGGTASGGWSGAKATSGSEYIFSKLTTTYTLICTGAGGSQVQSVTVTVQAANSGYRVVLPSATATAGGTATVTWTAPADRPPDDWLALYPTGVPRDTTNFRWVTNTDGQRKGTVRMSVPSTPGRYHMIYFLNDSYEEVARSVPFTVVEGIAPVPTPTPSASPLAIAEPSITLVALPSAVPVAPSSTIRIADAGLDNASQLVAWPDRLVQRLDNYRQGMIRVGGHFTVDTDVTLKTPWDLLRYLPRALSLAFLTPFPTQWFDTGGQTGSFRPLSSIEIILLFLLLPGMLFACGVLVRRHGEVGQAVVAFSFLAAVVLSLVIINIGILFRLRLQYLLPMLCAMGVNGALYPYQALWQAWNRLRQRSRMPLLMGGARRW